MACPCSTQAIIWTSDGLFWIGSLGTNFGEILIKYKHFFIEENTFENVICRMSAILPWPQFVRSEQQLAQIPVII